MGDSVVGTMRCRPLRGLNRVGGNRDPGARAPGFMLSPASRAQPRWRELRSWGLRHRLYAGARFAG